MPHRGYSRFWGPSTLYGAAGNGWCDLIKALYIIGVDCELVVHAESPITTSRQRDSVAAGEIISVRVHCDNADMGPGSKRSGSARTAGIPRLVTTVSLLGWAQPKEK
jgi:hypothetical protein